MQKLFGPKQRKAIWGNPLPKDQSVLEADIRKYRGLLGSRTGLIFAFTHEHIGDLLSELGKVTKDPAHFEESNKEYQVAFNHYSINPTSSPGRRIRKKRDRSLLERDEVAKNFKPDDRRAPEPKEKERSEASRAALTEPTGARRELLRKRNPALKNWDTILETSTEDGALWLSRDGVPNGVEEFKKVALDPAELDGIEILKIMGDLRDIPDLAERFGMFPHLEFLDLRDTKIDELNVDKLPLSLQAIDLTDSVVPLPLPLPLQERLQDYFGEEAVFLTPREEQIQNYEETTLEEWVKEGGSVQGVNRDGFKNATLAYLWGDSDPSSLNVSGYNVGDFDDDFFAMIASDELTNLKMSRNKLLELDLAKVALSPNLKKVNARHNLILQVQNAESVAQLDSLETLDMENNKLARLPDGIESAPESCKINFKQNLLTPFSIIDARLIKYAQGEREEMLDGYLRKQRGPAVVTDRFANDQGTIASYEYSSSVLDDLDKNSKRITGLEKDLKNLGGDASSHAARARLREVAVIVERETFVQALESIFTSQGGSSKLGRMEPYYKSTVLAATIAGNRAVTLHPLPGQADIKAGPKPGLKDASMGVKAIGLGAKGYRNTMGRWCRKRDSTRRWTVHRCGVRRTLRRVP